MSPLKLVVFDVDGTLVDSQAHIGAAMDLAFESLALTPPAKGDVLSLVGLSLDVMMPKLAPDQDAGTHQALVQAYKDAFVELRARGAEPVYAPLFAGAREAVEALHGVPEVLLGIATGKSRRGLDKVMEAHQLQSFFISQQVADFHPSKPHPAMLQACLEDTGVLAEHAVMIGDTSFDMDMAKAAGFKAIGVSWGYHARAALGAADIIIDQFEDLPGALEQVWS